MRFLTFKISEICENMKYIKGVKYKMQEDFELQTNTPKSIVSQELLA